MNRLRLPLIALIAVFSLGLVVGCDSEELKSKVKDAADSGLAQQVDALKAKFGKLDISGIEAKAKEMGKLDLPEIKELLSKKADFQKLLDSVQGGEGLADKLKELTTKFSGLEQLVKKAKAALGM
ncbi:MAG: hypothetical protein R3F20_07905 [Planctomycetota bacterium]